MIGAHQDEHTAAEAADGVVQDEELLEPADDALDASYRRPSPSSKIAALHVDLFVAYSPVYRVPVLYFRARRQGKHSLMAVRVSEAPQYWLPLADGAIVDLDSILASSFFHTTSNSEYPLNTLRATSPSPSGQTESESEFGGSEQAHFPAISQGEHPQTGLPCFYVHPCETSSALEEVLVTQGKGATPLQVIETWFMLISTIVDLR